MAKLIILFFIIFIYGANLYSMEKIPYHHLQDGTFRNPEGSPKRDSSFNWSFKIFNEEKKKLNIDIPANHVINKKTVLENLNNTIDIGDRQSQNRKR